MGRKTLLIGRPNLAGKELRQADIYFEQLLKQPTDVQFTGERVIPSKDDRYLLAEHLARYAIARAYVSGKNVLDVGCGDGYGSAFMADKAHYVVGVDIDHDSIENAKNKYIRNNMIFIEYDIEGSKTIAATYKEFQVITAFEILEHLQNPAAFLTKLKSLLTPDGTLMISTPNAAISSPNNVVQNPYHRLELKLEEFAKMLDQTGFKKFTVLGQVHVKAHELQAKRQRRASIASLLVKLDLFKFRCLFEERYRRRVLTKTGLSISPLSQKAYPSEFIFVEGNLDTASHFIAVLNNHEE